MEYMEEIIWLEDDMFMKNISKFDGFSVDYLEILPGAIESNVIHRQCDEFIYILQGELMFNLNGNSFLLKSGEHVNIPQNTIHGSINQTNDNVKVLSVCSPPFELSFMTKAVENDET